MDDERTEIPGEHSRRRARVDLLAAALCLAGAAVVAAAERRSVATAVARFGHSVDSGAVEGLIAWGLLAPASALLFAAAALPARRGAGFRSAGCSLATLAIALVAALYLAGGHLA